MVDVYHCLKERTGRSLVCLRAGPNAAKGTAAALNLPAEPLRWRGRDPVSIWIGPGQWLLASDSMSARELTTTVGEALPNRLCVATDVSDALDCWELSGHGARTILSMGCGLDLDSGVFTYGHCARTRFACVPLVITATGEDLFDLYVDRSYSCYFQRWFENAAGDPLTRASSLGYAISSSN